MSEGVGVAPHEGDGLLALFWGLSDISPKRRAEAACKLVHRLVNEKQPERLNSGGHKKNGQQQVPGVAAVDTQKVQCMLTAPDGASGVPYDLQYAINRLLQGLASPSLCTRQAYALALLLLLLQLSQQKAPIAHVNLSAFCQNLRSVFATKQAVPSEVKHLHLGRCLGVYILLCLGFFKKKQCLPEVTEVLDMLWEAFHGKLQLQEASGFLIRQVLRQLAELEQGEVGLEACQRRLRGIGSSQRLAQLEDIDKAKASEIGKTATGRLPCSLLEVYVHLQADMQQELLPDAEWLHMDIFTADNLPCLAAYLSDTAAAHPRLHGLWSGVIRLLLLRRDANEVFSRFWAAVDARLYPLKPAKAFHAPGSETKKPQEQSHQSAFVGFRAALLVLHTVRQRLLLPEATDGSALRQNQLLAMASAVFTEGKGFTRVLLAHIESPRSPLHGIARFTIERLEEMFSHSRQLGAAQGHVLCASHLGGKNDKKGILKSHELSSRCQLQCGCQVDPYAQGLLEPLLGEPNDEAEHLQPFGANFEMLVDPLKLPLEKRVAVLSAFGEACRFQPLKRQSLWRLGRICFSSVEDEELDNLIMLLLAALNKAPASAAVSTEERRAVDGRKAIWLLDILLMLPQLVEKNADGEVLLLDWLLSAVLCSCWFKVRMVSSTKTSQLPILAATVDLGERNKAPSPSIPEGMEDLSIAMKSVQLPQLLLVGEGTSALNGSGHLDSTGTSAASAARNRMGRKICHLLGSSCTAAMERCMRVDGAVASDYAIQLHRAHAQLFQLMEREKSSGSTELELRATIINDKGASFKAKAFITSDIDGSSAFQQLEYIEEVLAFCYYASGQGAACTAAASCAAQKTLTVHSGFVAAAQVLSMAVCALSLLPYLLRGRGGTSDVPGGTQEDEYDGADAEGAEDASITSRTAGSAARAFANVDTQSAEAPEQEEHEELLDAVLSALHKLLQVIGPIHTYLQRCDEKKQEAAVAALARAAAISSNLLLRGGNTAASGLLREVAGGLWKSFSCFASSCSLEKLLGVATATSNSPNATGLDSSEAEDQSEDETTNEDEECSSENGDEDEDADDGQSSSTKMRLHAGRSNSDRDGEDESTSGSMDELEADPTAVRLSVNEALMALADDNALPDAYCPPGGFKKRQVSQRKLLLRQRQRFGELRLRALAALQVYVHNNGSSPLALHLLTSLYAAFSHVLIQAAQSRKRKQKLAVYDDLAKKIRRTIELALKGATHAWQVKSSTFSEGSGKSVIQRRASSILTCYQLLQEQRLQVLLQRAQTSSLKEKKRKQRDEQKPLQYLPIMPTLEDGDRLELFLNGKQSYLLFDNEGGVADTKQRGGTAEHKQDRLAQALLALIAEEMVNVLRVCSRKLPPQLANQNQVLGAEMLLQLSKLEQQVNGYYTSASEGNAGVCREAVMTQLLSVALAARSQVRRCHLKGCFFETLAERRPEVFRFCDVYGSAIRSRTPFVRRELAQVAFRVYKHSGLAALIQTEASASKSYVHVGQRRLPVECVLRSLLFKGHRATVDVKKRLLGTAKCEPLMIPRKALQSLAAFSVFIICRLVELTRETSEAKVTTQQPKSIGDQQQQKQDCSREEGGDKRHDEQALVFSSLSQKQAAICEQLKQLQQLLRTFARRDQQQRSTVDDMVEQKGFKERLQGKLYSLEQTVQEAAATVGGKKPLNLANTITAVLKRMTAGELDNGRCDEEAKAPPQKRKRVTVENNPCGTAREKRKEKSSRRDDAC